MTIFRFFLSALIIAIGVYISFTIYAIGIISPYVNGDMFGALIILLVVAYGCGLVLADLDFDHSVYIKINMTTVGLLIGTLIFFILFITNKESYEKDIADGSFGKIIDKVGLNRDISKNLYLNDDQKKLFNDYHNRNFDELKNYVELPKTLEKINDEKLAQLIVNVKAFDNKMVTDTFVKYMEDNVITDEEYQEINKLIIQETVKRLEKQKGSQH